MQSGQFANSIPAFSSRYCSQTELVQRNGKARSGLKEYRCTDCRRSFHYEYLSRGYASGTAT